MDSSPQNRPCRAPRISESKLDPCFPSARYIFRNRTRTMGDVRGGCAPRLSLSASCRSTPAQDPPQNLTNCSAQKPVGCGSKLRSHFQFGVQFGSGVSSYERFSKNKVATKLTAGLVVSSGELKVSIPMPAFLMHISARREKVELDGTSADGCREDSG